MSSPTPANVQVSTRVTPHFAVLGVALLWVFGSCSPSDEPTFLPAGDTTDEGRHERPGPDSGADPPLLGDVIGLGPSAATAFELCDVTLEGELDAEDSVELDGGGDEDLDAFDGEVVNSSGTDLDVGVIDVSDFELDASLGRWIPHPVVTSEARLAVYPSGHLGLAGNNLVWTDTVYDGERTVGNVYVRDVDGIGRLVHSGEDNQARTGDSVAGERFVSWAGYDEQGIIFLYDLGPDQRVESGDELLAQNPFPLVRIEGRGPISFDWDFDAFELVYIDEERSSIEVRRLDVTASPDRLVVAQYHRVCENCTELDYYRSGTVALDHGCITFSDQDRRVRLYCRNNEIWGDGDDTDLVISNPAGECSSEFTKVTMSSGLRTIDVGRVDNRVVVAWTAISIDLYPGVAEVCLWSEAAGPARRIFEPSLFTVRTLTISDNLLVFFDVAVGSAADDFLEVKGYRIRPDTFSGEVKSVPIMPGRLSRLFADGDRIAVARQRDGPDWIEVYELRNHPVTPRLYDQVTPDVDGDRRVWVDYRHHHCGEIYLYDRSVDSERRLTHTDCAAGQYHVALMCPRISGSHVVWSQTSPDWRISRFCQGDIFGLDLESSPSDGDGQPIHITSELGEQSVDYSRIGRAQISDGRVVFDVLLVDNNHFVYLYEWGGDKPLLGEPITDGFGMQPDISGDRIVYVGRDMTTYEQDILTCRLSESCDSPVALTHTPDPCLGVLWGDQFYCYPIHRYRPRIDGDVVVWLSNGDSYELGSEFPNEAIFQLYSYDLSSPVENGTQVSTTLWQSGWSTGAFDLIQGFGDYPAGFWDYVEPSIGYDPDLDTPFVVITSLHRTWLEGYSSYPGLREMVRIDLGGARAFEEQLLSTGSAWQGPPAADAFGQIVWQDRSDGTFFKIVELAEF